jgi:hypothetical protein
MENNKYDCRLELSTECTNAIKISGKSKETVRECAKWIRTIRNDLMKSWKPLEETHTIGTHSVELAQKGTQEDEILKMKMKEQKSHYNGKEIEKILSGHPKVINWLDEVEKRQENSSKEVAKPSAIVNKEDYSIKKKRDISVGRKMLKVYFEDSSFNKDIISGYNQQCIIDAIPTSCTYINKLPIDDPFIRGDDAGISSIYHGAKEISWIFDWQWRDQLRFDGAKIQCENSYSAQTFGQR